MPTSTEPSVVDTSNSNSVKTIGDSFSHALASVSQSYAKQQAHNSEVNAKAQAHNSEVLAQHQLHSTKVMENQSLLQQQQAMQHAEAQQKAALQHAQNQYRISEAIMSNTINHQANLNAMFAAYMGGHFQKSNSVDVIEAVSAGKLFKSEADSSVATLLTQLNTGHIGAKTAQSTPGDNSLEMAKLGAMIGALEGQVGSLVATIQMLMKGAQTTPPETGKQG